MNAEISFEWDVKKAETNLKKHNVSFEEASSVFMDENAILFDDPDHSIEEDRFLIIGFSEKLRLLIVSHCIRQEDTIRIISARNATKNERKEYSEINKKSGAVL